MKKFVVGVLLLIFTTFPIMAENVINVLSPANEIKNSSEILLKCSNAIGESTQGIGTSENNGNNIFFKCLNSENNNENMIGINKINSKDILLKCLNTNENAIGEIEQNGNSDEKILKCSNSVKIISLNELSQIEKIGSDNGVQLKCSNTVKSVNKPEIPLSDGNSNDIILKCSNVSENSLKNEEAINSKAVNPNEITLKCSNIVRVINGNEVFLNNLENYDAVILKCSDTTEKAGNIIGNIGQSKGNIGSLGGNIGGNVPIGPIIGGVTGVGAIGAIIGGIGHHGGGSQNGGSSGANNGGKDGISDPKKQKTEEPKVHDVKGIGIQPVNPFWRSNLKEAEESYSNIAKVGFQWVRITASWHRIQSQKNGSYDWQDIDDAVALARKYNLKVLMQISGAPEWATGADKLSAAEKNALNARKIWVASFAPLPQYNNDFSNFVSALVKRYARQGVIDYEFWNEPGNPEFWHDTIQNPKPNPEHYTQLLKIAYTAAHNAYNDVNVMAGGMTVGVSNTSTGYIGPMEFLERMYRAGAKGYFDGISHHPYGIYARTFRDNGWANMIGDVVKPGSGEKTLYQIMSEHGDGNKKIWPSEVGLDAAYPGVDETKQANVISQILGWYQNSNIFGPLILYQAKDRKPYITSGVLDRDSNGDGWLDVNIDTNGDGIPDANIDGDNNGRPDVLDAADPENYFGIWKSDGTEKKAVDVIRKFLNNQPATPAPVPNACSTIDSSGKQWQKSKCYEFNDGKIPTDWKSANVINHLGSHTSYLPNSVSLSSGAYVQLTTRRHCVDKKGEPLTNANATTGVCPAGKITQYSSGRFESDGLIDASKPFRAEVRAKINWNKLVGMRTALWLNKKANDSSIRTCVNPTAGDAPYGSLILLEWYSSTPAYMWPASNISCYYNKKESTWETRMFGHRLENREGGKPKSLENEWHTWIIDFDGTTIRYYMDDKLIPVNKYRVNETTTVNVIDKNYLSTMPDEDYTKLGISPSLVKQTLENDKWYFIFNEYVEYKSGLHPVSDKVAFPVQTTQIDYVRLYQK